MEFHEKLQHLRKQKGLTQEQLAQELFVSRTAISKWESGRGYPNLDSLKGISRLFSISIDDLLSNDELMVLAQQENRSNLRALSCLVFGVLDLITAAFFFLPLFGLQEGETVHAVSLLAYSGPSQLMDTLYVTGLALLPLVGLAEVILCLSSRDTSLCRICSLALHGAVILLFSISPQPYVSSFLFLLFLGKLLFLFKENNLFGSKNHP
ncbi:MAG: helix-turn-helix transcriptional regulator [Ruminiclostridium sp.]|nr:helix-turn-helix transcriptional regulator [Ruminiclostridium sp.]